MIFYKYRDTLTYHDIKQHVRPILEPSYNRSTGSPGRQVICRERSYEDPREKSATSGLYLSVVWTRNPVSCGGIERQPQQGEKDHRIECKPLLCRSRPTAMMYWLYQIPVWISPQGLPTCVKSMYCREIHINPRILLESNAANGTTPLLQKGVKPKNR